MTEKEGPRPSIIHEKDARFFEDLERNLDLFDRIASLEQDELGRSITAYYPKEEHPLHGKTIGIGYILPLRLDNMSHLVIFKNRKALVIEPINKENPALVSEYRDNFSPNEGEFRWNINQPRIDLWADISMVASCFNRKAKIVFSSEPADIAPLSKLIAKARPVSESLRRVRNAALGEVTDIFLEQFENDTKHPLFKEPPHDPPDDPIKEV